MAGRFFSIVPAAGKSSRMGRPKLLLPFEDERLIDRVLRAWTDSRVSQVVVIVRTHDTELRSACEKWAGNGIVIVVAPKTDPVDMTQSLQIGLRHLEDRFQPRSDDACFFAPADLPGISTQVIDRLCDNKLDSSRIVVPQFGDRAGHPVLFPWDLTKQIFETGLAEGVKSIVDRSEKHPVLFAESERPTDVNTPEEYDRAAGRLVGRGKPRMDANKFGSR